MNENITYHRWAVITLNIISSEKNTQLVKFCWSLSIRPRSVMIHFETIFKVPMNIYWIVLLLGVKLNPHHNLLLCSNPCCHNQCYLGTWIILVAVSLSTVYDHRIWHYRRTLTQTEECNCLYKVFQILYCRGFFWRDKNSVDLCLQGIPLI